MIKDYEISEYDANKIRSQFGDYMELHSTFTHCEGHSPYSRYWTDIETNYSWDFLIFKIHTIRETKESEEYTKYYVTFNTDWFGEISSK